MSADSRGRRDSSRLSITSIYCEILTVCDHNIPLKVINKSEALLQLSCFQVIYKTL